MSRLTYAISAASVLLLTLTGCGSDRPQGSVEPAGPVSAASPGATSDPASPQVRTAVERDCGTAAPVDVEIEDVTIEAVDGVRLRAAILGSGPRGVVMLHQTDDGLCGWLPYAGRLAGAGFQVAVFDRRCTFGSSCVAEPAAYDFIGDVEAVTATLRKRGVDRTALVGASFGGAVAIGACAVLRPRACVALSPALFDNYLGGGVTADNAIVRVRAPLLVAVAPDDASSPLETVEALTARARRGVVTSVTLPAGGAHGWDTVIDPAAPNEPTPFSARLVAFLNQHLSPR